MFHYFQWTICLEGEKKFLINDMFGLEVYYLGTRIKGAFYLYPYLDDTKKTVMYFAFDVSEQKVVYEKLLKISGIGYKTAFQIVQMPWTDIQKALEDLDVKFFQNIPGIWPKTAKKILLELKDTFKPEDIQRMDMDQRLYKNILSSLKNFGYSAERIKTVLQQYDWKITQENLGEVIKWVIGKM